MKRRLVFILALFALAGTQQAPAAPDPVMAPINQIMNAFNAGDVKAVLAACDPAGISVIDDVPPFTWNGRAAMPTWLKDLSASESKAGITGGKVSFGAAIYRIANGSQAYVVLPTVYHFRQHGKPMHDSARMAFALRKSGNRWLISSWAWAGSTPVAGP